MKSLNDSACVCKNTKCEKMCSFVLRPTRAFGRLDEIFERSIILRLFSSNLGDDWLVNKFFVLPPPALFLLVSEKVSSSLLRRLSLTRLLRTARRRASRAPLNPLCPSRPFFPIRRCLSQIILSLVYRDIEGHNCCCCCFSFFRFGGLPA